MRISDWSSDVCSSDLSVDDDAFRLRRPPDAQPRRAGAPDLARLLRPATRHVAGTRHGGVRERRELSDGLARRPVWTPPDPCPWRRLLVAGDRALRLSAEFRRPVRGDDRHRDRRGGAGADRLRADPRPVFRTAAEQREFHLLWRVAGRGSEEATSELQSTMRIS